MFGDKNSWKGRLLRFALYAIVGFLCAFLYKYLRK